MLNRDYQALPATETKFLERLRQAVSEVPQQVAFTFLVDGEDEEISLTFAELHARAIRVAAHMTARGMHGERALLLFPPGLEFIVGLLGCFYAGVVAVPAFPPRRNRNMDRLQAISRDARARLALTVRDVVDRTQRFMATEPELARLEWIAVDGQTETSTAPEFVGRPVCGDDLALLQYTSGSTGSPKGVMLTHNNIAHNCETIFAAFENQPQDVGMSWLPAYHDMGLIGGILSPMFAHCRTILISPTHFLQKPVRWLRAISRYRVSVSGGPNFAYDICSKKISDHDLVGLDLSSWVLAYNGAEPVRAATMESFTARFSACGFQRTAFYPCYGMAEATLMITGGRRSEAPSIRYFDGERLDQRQVRPVAADHPGARRLVACGRVPTTGQLIIVDPDAVRPSADHEVGEIWVASDSVGQGYLDKPQPTRSTFHATLPKYPHQHFLRTGDLGFFHEGQLYITGRLKDLIIIRGVNRYPQDIEATAEQSDGRLRPGAAAAFAAEIDSAERLILCCEVERVAGVDWEMVLASIRQAVTLVHDVPPDGVVLIRAGSLPKTSSGKIQRHACRARFLDNSLLVVASWFAWQPGSVTSRRRVDTAASTSTWREAEAPGYKLALQQVFGAVGHALGPRRAETLTPETNLLRLGLDSLQRLEIANELEDRYGRNFPEAVLHEIETCHEVALAVVQYLAGIPTTDSPILPPAETGRLPQARANWADPSQLRENVEFSRFPEYLALMERKRQLDRYGYGIPYFQPHDGIAGAEVVIDGRRLVNFSSYNYLGMSGHPSVTAAAVEAVRQEGTSCSASRLVSGEKRIHRQLEETLAEFLGVASALVFVGGHATNETTIGHLCGPHDLVLFDELAHNSIQQGAKLSGARRRAFPHNDWRYLDDLLPRVRSRFRRVLIAIEGTYSMDGDFPPLDQFVAVKQRHSALLLVDEAHSLGTLGATGRGIAEHYGLPPSQVDIWMGTLSKALGSCGGYIAGSRELVELLRYTAPGFVFSVGMPPASAAAALAALQTLRAEPQRVAACRAQAERFRQLARQAGFDTGASQGTPIVPVILGNSGLALTLACRLFHRGINVHPILAPAVAESAARLRFFISAEHSESQIRTAVRLLQDEFVALPSPTSVRPSS